MENQTQLHFSPSSNRFPQDLADSEVSKMTNRLASLLVTPPRKRQNTDDDLKLKCSPVPRPAVSSVSEFQPAQQEQEDMLEKIQEVSVTVAVKEEAEKEQEKQEENKSKQARCRYCDQAFAAEQLRAHQDDCNMRTIDCEACGEKVELDIFDFHIETCAARADNYEAMLHAAQEQFLASLLQNGGLAADNQEAVEGEGEENQENNVNPNAMEIENMADQEGQEDQEEPYDDEEDDGFDPDAFTYEQLLTLDNTIVKKGMSAEEMQKFPVKVYLKNFDGHMSCSVCISDCESGEVVRELSCGHKFHRDCVDTWLESNITCPVCKKYFR